MITQIITHFAGFYYTFEGENYTFLLVPLHILLQLGWQPWVRPGGLHKTEIDYILVNTKVSVV